MPPRFTEDPRALYRSRIERRRAEANRSQQHHVLLGYIRLALVLAALLLAWLALYLHALSPWWLLLPCVAFILAARMHSTVLLQKSQAERAIAFFSHGIERMDDRWSDVPARTPRTDAASSLFAGDLDLFSRGGLFDLLCTARTSIGEDTLASWLLEPASRDEVLARQSSIAELREHFDLRETLASLEGADVAALDLTALAAWGTTPEPVLPAFLRWLAPALVVLTLAAFIRYLMVDRAAPLIAIILIDATITFSLQKRTQSLFRGAEHTSRSLRLASALIDQLESEHFDTPQLRALQHSFAADGNRSASAVLARLATLASFIEHRANYILRILDAPLMYSIQLACAVQSWRRAHGAALQCWLEALAHVEALLSLATYSYEHPADPFPEIADGAPCFHAQQLGHPLLAAAQCVRNDVALGDDTHLLLVSGSNMSGKSTLLRAIGVNAILAMAGAPVRAAHLRLTPLRVAASLQVNDSLQEGRSRFYAEILRLRAICALAEQRPPVLFLLDELLDGTNSSDRLTGATGIARALLASNAIGLISTHDLALTSMDAPGLRNVHFDDLIENGEMRFDFTLRDGPVTTRNGLALMRLVGINV